MFLLGVGHQAEGSFGQPSSCWWLKSLPSAPPLLQPPSQRPLPHPAPEQGVFCCGLWERPRLRAGPCRQVAGVREGNWEGRSKTERECGRGPLLSFTFTYSGSLL